MITARRQRQQTVAILGPYAQIIQSMLKDLIDIIVEHIDIRQIRIIVITKSGRIAVRCDLTVKSREYFKIQPLKAAVLVNDE